MKKKRNPVGVKRDAAKSRIKPAAKAKIDALIAPDPPVNDPTDGLPAPHHYGLSAIVRQYEALIKMLQSKALLEAELDELKIRRTFLQRDEYLKEFERIITELARVSSAIRQRGKT